jgi:hypothetical protein
MTVAVRVGMRARRLASALVSATVIVVTTLVAAAPARRWAQRPAGTTSVALLAKRAPALVAPTAASGHGQALPVVAVEAPAVPISAGASSSPEPVASLVAAARPACLLLAGKSDSSPDAACLSCHSTDSAGNHRSGFAYEDGRARLRPGSLRPLDEVVRLGLFLPDGEVRCATCHDSRSSWKDHLALPPGAKVDHAARVGAPEVGQETTRRRPQPGDAVTPTPLCRSCHTIGD